MKQQNKSSFDDVYDGVIKLKTDADLHTKVSLKTMSTTNQADAVISISTHHSNQYHPILQQLLHTITSAPLLWRCLSQLQHVLPFPTVFGYTLMQHTACSDVIKDNNLAQHYRVHSSLTGKKFHDPVINPAQIFRPKLCPKFFDLYVSIYGSAGKKWQTPAWSTYLQITISSDSKSVAAATEIFTHRRNEAKLASSSGNLPSLAS